MPLVYPNLVCERTSTLGQGDLVLTGAVSPNFTFSAKVADGAQFYYRISEGSKQEGGEGTYRSATNRIERTTVKFSSAGGTTKITLTTGKAKVWVDVLGEYFTTAGGSLISGNNLSDVASVPAARNNLGLGTMALQDADVVAITGGSISGAEITLPDSLLPETDDGAMLGSAAKRFSGLFLALGRVINWANGNITLTQGNGFLTLAGGYLYASGTPVSLYTAGAVVVRGAISDDTNANLTISGGTSGRTVISKIVGGTGTTSTLTLQPTSGVGATGADIVFKGGNNGATEFGRFLNAGPLLLGTASVLGGSSANLQVQGTTANHWAAYIKGDATTGQSYGQFITAGTNSSDIAFWIQSAGGVDYFKVRGDGTASFSGSLSAGATTLTSLSVSGAATVDSSGRLFLPNGASGAGNLAISFVNDTNTGLYRSAADEIAIQTGGVTAVTVDASQRVLIGAGVRVGISTDPWGTGVNFLTQGPTTTDGKAGIALFGSKSTSKSALFISASDSAVYLQPTWANAANLDVILGGITSGGTYRETLTLGSAGTALVTAGLAGVVPLTLKLAATPSAHALDINSSSGSGGDLAYISEVGAYAIRGAVRLKDANSGQYTQLMNGDTGVAGLSLGGTGANTNYYDNTTHTFRSSGGATELVTISASGVTIGGATIQADEKLHVKLATNENFILRPHQNIASGIAIYAGNDAFNALVPMEFSATSWGFYGTGNALRLTLDSLGNVVTGAAALATNATDGFSYIPSCAGPPTGTPTTFTGRVPVIFDSTNDIFYIYRAGWKKATANIVTGAITWV